MEITPHQKRVFKKWWKGIGTDERQRIQICFWEMNGVKIPELTEKEIRQRQRRAARGAKAGK